MQTPIGQILIDLDVLEGRDLDRALRAQRERGGRLGDILRNLGLISDGDWARALAQKSGHPMAVATDYPKAPLFEGRISDRFLKESRVVPLRQTNDGVALAMADPFDAYTIEAMELAVGEPVIPFVGTEQDIEAALTRLYQAGRESVTDIVEELATDLTGGDEEDIERLVDLASEAPVIRLVNLIIARALDARASDIHIEPYEKRLNVRYRIDGILRDAESPAPQLGAAVVSRVKIMASLNIAERRLAQDGRIRLRMQGKDIDLRVSTLPTLYGESVVMRILERDSVRLDFDALGFEKTVRSRLEDALSHHHGIMLVTGPTGSGKTTTLYAAMTHLNAPERKIVTVEDPVEYQIDGVTQIQVNARIGLTFANVLRSFVRHDPDVMMVGEMRDTETAEIAVQSALTGHLVLSTLHTNDAVGAVTRLLDMGVEPFLLTSTVNAVVAQRLVRTLCNACREPYEAPAEVVEMFGLASAGAAGPVTLYRSVGCDDCGGFGFSGRMAIVEVLAMDSDMRDLVLKRADAATLQRAAIVGGMTTMFEDGMDKACAGVTTIEEVMRVTRDTA